MKAKSRQLNPIRRGLALLLVLVLLLSAIPCASASAWTQYGSEEALIQAARDLIQEQLDPSDYLSLTEFGLTDSQIQELTAVAQEVTRHYTTVSSKLQRIAAWIADSVYYDYPTYYGSADRAQDPYTVYESKLAICYGYANLSCFMIRALGIPCFTVYGTVPVQNGGVHRWTAAWTGSKWLYLDTCWMSKNRTYDGETLNYQGYSIEWFNFSAAQSAGRTFTLPMDTVVLDGCVYQASLNWDALSLDYTLLGSMSNFKSLRSYAPGTFSDVMPGAWYASSVETAYRLGLVDGDTAGTYRPEDSVTLAEAVKLAVLVHSTYAGRTAPRQTGSSWYQAYVDYALTHHIIPAGTFTDYTRAATRGELAFILSGSLPDSCLAARRELDAVPDMTSRSAYYSQVLLLYRAGVLGGMDEIGNFRPNDTVTRAQTAVILTRLTNASARLS